MGRLLTLPVSSSNARGLAAHITPIKTGGTGADNAPQALINLGFTSFAAQLAAVTNVNQALQLLGITTLGASIGSASTVSEIMTILGAHPVFNEPLISGIKNDGFSFSVSILTSNGYPMSGVRVVTEYRDLTTDGPWVQQDIFNFDINTSSYLSAITGLQEDNTYVVRARMVDTANASLNVPSIEKNVTTYVLGSDFDSSFDIAGPLVTPDVLTYVNGDLSGSKFFARDSGAFVFADKVHQQQGQSDFNSLSATFSFKPKALTFDATSTPTSLKAFSVEGLKVGDQVYISNNGMLSRSTVNTVSASVSERLGKPETQNVTKYSSQKLFTDWKIENKNTLAVQDATVVVTDTHVLMIGGRVNNAAVKNVLYAKIDKNGDVETFQDSVNQIPEAVMFSQAVRVDNHVYLIGGSTAGGVSSKIWKTTLDASGMPGAWIDYGVLPSARTHHQAIVVKNKLHVIGGWNGGDVSTVYTADINSDGTLGSWTTGISLPDVASYHQVLVTASRVYVLGGLFKNTVYSCAFDDAGTLGAWATGTALPDNYYWGTAVSTRHRVWLIGGQYGVSYTRSVLTSEIRDDGSIGPWEELPNTLPTQLLTNQVFVTRTRLFLFAGYDATLGSVVTSMQSANFDGWYGLQYATYKKDTMTLTPAPTTVPKKIFKANQKPMAYIGNLEGFQYADLTKHNLFAKTATSKISTWDTHTPLPYPPAQPLGAFGRFITFIVGNNLYVAGGRDDGVIYQNVYRSIIDSNGNVGVWEEVPSLPKAVHGASVIQTPRFVYILGGRDSSGNTKTVYRALKNTDGTIGQWVQVTDLPMFSYQQPIVVVNNNVYMLGGMSDDTTFVTTIYATSIDANGEIGSWSNVGTVPVSAFNTAFLTKNYVYIASNGVSSTTMYRCSFDVNGTLSGSWSAYGSEPVSQIEARSVASENQVFLIGGDTTGSLSHNKIFSAPIDATGNVGSWVEIGQIPIPCEAPGVAVTNNNLYVIPGVRQTSSTSYLYYRSVYSFGFDGWNSKSDQRSIKNYFESLNVEKEEIFDDVVVMKCSPYNKLGKITSIGLFDLNRSDVVIRMKANLNTV